MISQERIEEIKKADLSKLKVSELKSLLSELGVDQPPNKEKKDVYQSLLRNWMAENETGKGTKRKNEVEEKQEENPPKSKVKKTSSSSNTPRKSLRSDSERKVVEEVIPMEVVNLIPTVLSPVNYFQNSPKKSKPNKILLDSESEEESEEESSTESSGLENGVSLSPVKSRTTRRISTNLPSTNPPNRIQPDVSFGDLKSSSEIRGEQRVGARLSLSSRRDEEQRAKRRESFEVEKRYKELNPRANASNFGFYLSRRSTPLTSKSVEKVESPVVDDKVMNRKNRSTSLDKFDFGLNPVADEPENDTDTLQEDSTRFKSNLTTLIALSSLVFLSIVLFMTPLGRNIYHTSFPKFCATGAPNQTGCIPCPINGQCDDGYLKCDKGYVRQGNSCVEDPRTLALGSKLVYAIHRNLSRLAGDYECGLTSSRSLSGEELKQSLVKEFSSDPQFPGAFEKALETIKDGKASSLKYESVNGYFSEDPQLSHFCQAKLAALNHMDIVFYVVVLIGLFLYIYWKVETWRSDQRKVAEKTEQVYSLLQKQKQAFDKGKETSPQFIVNHVRDTLYRPPVDTKKRDRIWKKVEAIVNSDTRVQSAPLFFHGEQEEAWEWTAPILEERDTSVY